MCRRLILAFSCLVICLAFVPAAAAFSVDCTLYGPSSAVNINMPSANVEINCALIVKSVLIRAHSITVGNTGSIATTGTAGIKLYAGLNSTATACTDADPTTAIITINGAPLEDGNSNGGITLKSCWDINFRSGSSVRSVGAPVHAECLWPTVAPIASPWGCQVVADHSQFYGNRIEFFSQGDMTLICSTFDTVGPLDQHTYESLFGNLFAGEVCTVAGSPAPKQPISCQSVIDFVNGNCVNGLIDSSIFCTLCQELPLCCHNEFSGGVESNFFAFAEQTVDLSAACVNIAMDITITADGRFPFAPYNPTGGGVGPGGTYYIDLHDAEIRDDFGKTGFISITALPALAGNGKPVTPGNVPFLPPNAGHGCSPTWLGYGPIWYEQAVLVDDGARGGGVDPQAVSFMNGCRTAIAGNCSVPVQDLKCSTRTIPARGFVADPADRILHFVAGIPRCDS